MPYITGPKAATPAGIDENIERVLAEGATADEAASVAFRLAEEARSQHRPEDHPRQGRPRRGT